MFLNGIFQCTAQRYCNHCNQIKKCGKFNTRERFQKIKKYKNKKPPRKKPRKFSTLFAEGGQT